MKKFIVIIAAMTFTIGGCGKIYAGHEHRETVDVDVDIDVDVDDDDYHIVPHVQHVPVHCETDYHTQVIRITPVYETTTETRTRIVDKVVQVEEQYDVTVRHQVGETSEVVSDTEHHVTHVATQCSHCDIPHDYDYDDVDVDIDIDVDVDDLGYHNSYRDDNHRRGFMGRRFYDDDVDIDVNVHIDDDDDGLGDNVRRVARIIIRRLKRRAPGGCQQ